MKEKFINQTHIVGRLYQHKLNIKESGPNTKHPGTKFINGEIEIATDDLITNIVTVHFTYVTPTTESGKDNKTYPVLENIINGTYKSVLGNSKEEATFFRIDSATSLNEFYSDRDGKTELISVKRNEGGFVHAINQSEYEDEAENARSTFTCDMFINNVKHIDADEEKDYPEKVKVCGYIFDFRKALLPVEFSAVGDGAINYFMGLEASNKNPTFTKVSGKMISETVITKKEEKSAFGEASVREFKNTRKDYVITWAKEEPYEVGDDGDITAKFMKDGLAERETYLATVKQRQDEYAASKKKGSTVTAASGGFDF